MRILITTYYEAFLHKCNVVEKIIAYNYGVILDYILTLNIYGILKFDNFYSNIQALNILKENYFIKFKKMVFLRIINRFLHILWIILC